MKLYFYIIVRDFETTRIMQEECDVVEKKNTYWPVGKFPDYFYRIYVKKGEIGRVIGGCNETVILFERNADRAKQIFSYYYQRDIKFLKKELQEKEELLSAVAAFEG